MAKIALENIRQTYIFLYEKDDVRYVFNRSVSWSGINFQKLQPLIDLLGESTIKHILVRITDLKDNICTLTKEWMYDDGLFKILEIHNEWTNYNLQNQRQINIRKNELADIYDAVTTTEQIDKSEWIDNIIKEIKANLTTYIRNIYFAICEYDRKLKDEINLRYDDYIKSKKRELENLDIQIEMNKEKLRRQNYVLSNPKKYRLDNKYENNY